MTYQRFGRAGCDPATSGIGTNRTNRTDLTMSVTRGRPEDICSR